MPKTRKQKEELVQKLKEDFNNLKAAVFTNYQGLTVGELDELRELLRKEGVKYSVVKTNLARIAAKDTELKNIEIPDIKKPLAIAFGLQDEVAAAKIISKFAKEHKKPEVLFGVLEGRAISAQEVASLAKLPSRDELLAKFVGTIKAPISGFVNVLAGNIRGLINVLNSLKEQKDKQAS